MDGGFREALFKDFRWQFSNGVGWLMSAALKYQQYQQAHQGGSAAQVSEARIYLWSASIGLARLELDWAAFDLAFDDVAEIWQKSVVKLIRVALVYGRFRVGPAAIADLKDPRFRGAVDDLFAAALSEELPCHRRLV